VQIKIPLCEYTQYEQKLLIFKVQEFKAKVEQQKGPASNEEVGVAWATLATRPPTPDAFSLPRRARTHCARTG
jgi:hypothetical protein